MKEWYNIDQFNENLGDDLDLDQAWTNFEKKKRRRIVPIFLPFLLGLSLLLTGLLFVFNSKQDEMIKVQQNNDPYVDDQTNLRAEKNSFKSHEHRAGKMINQAIESKSTVKQKVELIDSDSQVDHLTETISHAKTEAQASSENYIETYSLSQQNNQTQETNTNFKTRGIGKTATTSSALNEQLHAVNQDIENDNNYYGVLDQRQYLKEAVESSMQSSTTISADFNSKNISGHLEGNRPSSQYVKPELVDIALLSKIPFDGLTQIFNLQQTQNFPLHQPPLLNPLRRSQWTIGLSHSIGKMNRIVQSESVYDLKRKEEELLLESNHLQFSVGKNIGSSFHLSSGFTLAQYRTKISNQIQKIFAPQYFENTILGTQTQNGFTETIIGTAVGSKTVITENVRYQRYQNIAIPLDLIVTLVQLNEWDVRIALGLEYSIYNRVQGKTIQSILPTAEYRPVQELGYRTHGMLEGKYSIVVQREVTDLLSAYAGYAARRDLNNRLAESSTVDKFGSHSFSVGLRWSL